MYLTSLKIENEANYFLCIEEPGNKFSGTNLDFQEKVKSHFFRFFKALQTISSTSAAEQPFLKQTFKVFFNALFESVLVTLACFLLVIPSAFFCFCFSDAPPFGSNLECFNFSLDEEGEAFKCQAIYYLTVLTKSRRRILAFGQIVVDVVVNTHVFPLSSFTFQYEY